MGMRLIAVVYLADRAVCVVSALDGSEVDPLLCLSAWSRLCCMRSSLRAKLDAFDEIVYWANVVRDRSMQPALFLHFAFTFSDYACADDAKRVRRGLLAGLLYMSLGVVAAGVAVSWRCCGGRRPSVAEAQAGQDCLRATWRVYYVMGGGDCFTSVALPDGRASAGASATEVA